MKRFRYTLFVTAVVFAFVFAAMTTAPVLADDGAPPPPDITTVDETPPADNVSEEAPPVDETAPVEEVESPEESAPAEETIAEMIESLPEGTEVVVADEAGEAVPLASEAAADAIEFIDPVWCPVGVTPKTDGTGGCTTSYGDLKSLIDALMSGSAGVVPNTSGVIWIQAGQDNSAGSMTLDGGDPDLVNMENFALTLQGGWNGTHGSAVISGSSTISDSLAIINWNGIVTLKDIVFSGVTTSTTPNNAALEIQTTKQIVLTNVDVENNTGGGVHGAVLLNDDGGVADDVVITNSTFTGNNGDGLYVNSNGAITITNLVANANGGYGAWLDNRPAASPKAVTLKGNVNQTKFNGSFGIFIQSDGVVTINSLTSNSNGGQGIAIDNTTGSAAVTLTGINLFRDNASSGIQVNSKGAITINNLASNNNGQTGGLFGYGADLQNNTAATPMPVRLTGTNEFYFNYTGGLQILSKGAVTLNNITVESTTTGQGVYIENNTNSAVPQNVAISGYSTANNNGGSGMVIYTYGVVSLAKVTANGNTGYGLYIDNATGASLPRGVTMSGANNFNNNTVGGLYIYSLGAITLNNVSANTNNGHGAELNNNFAGAVGGITITSVPSGTWNQFNGNAGSGLQAVSKGNITVAITDAFGNGSVGVLLDNNGPGATGNVTFGAGGLTGWCSGISENYYDGLYITSNGTVTVTSVCAYSNGDPGAGVPAGYGVFIDNSTAAAPKAVTLLGNNSSSENFDSGFYILTLGAVTLNNVYAEANGDFGTFIDNNTNPAAPQNVTVNGYGTFNQNGAGGLQIDTFGVVTLSNLYAENNTGNGVQVDNSTGGSLAKAVTIKGSVSVFGNTSDGLVVFSRGAISLANLDASDNGSGATLINSFAPTPAPVTITGGAFTVGNTIGHGLHIVSKGAITINVVDSWSANNATFGWTLDNNEPGAVGGVTLTPSPANNIDFSSNGTHGLLVQSLGTIKVTNLDSGGNGTYGAMLDNAFTGSVGTVTILAPLDGSYNNYSGNSGDGLIVYSNRAITVSKLIARYNGGDGIYLDNTLSGPSLPQPVTLNVGGIFEENGENGLRVYSYGVITTNNLSSMNNGQNGGSGGYGVILDNCLWNGLNCDATSSKPVMLKGFNTFNNNRWNGLLVTSRGAISVNNLTANDNGLATGWSGVYLFNQYDAGFFGVTLTGTNTVSGNGYNGLWIFTNGAVTLNNINSSWNVQDGTVVNSYNSTNQAVVKILGTNYFNVNGGTGLVIQADAAVTLNNVMANWNSGNGAFINNASAQAGTWSNATLTITGMNYFSANGGHGLSFYINSHVSISNITADLNDRDVTNSNGVGVIGESVEGSLTISCGSMTANNNSGWTLGAFTTVTLKGVFASGNLGTNGLLLSGTLVTTRTCP